MLIKIEGPFNKCEWYLNKSDTPVSSSDGYEGMDTTTLVIKKCFTKHKGSYHCVLTPTTGKPMHSRSAALTIGKYIPVINIL